MALTLVGVALLSASLPAQEAPMLTAASAGADGLRLTWSAADPNFLLEQTTDLSGVPVWQVVPRVPRLAGAQFQMTVPVLSAAAFYRLQSHPPPSPTSVAPALPLNRVTAFGDATAFLYSGPDSVQVAVTPGAIAPASVVVLRGKVFQADKSSLPDVRVSVLGHPELGYTLTRGDGRYDLAANGGGQVALVFEKAGWCEVQRQVATPWQDYVSVPDVVMMSKDATSTVVALGANAPPQIHRATPQTDANGTRQATVLFPAGTAAQLVMADGSVRSVNSLTVRVTELTVGTNGPAAMPAPLPPTSAYTHCSDFTADEAEAVGARSIEFNQAVPVYLENYLNIPVGTPVPAGWYDRQAGNWKAGRDGRVVKLLSVSGGLAGLDVTGGGTNATSGDLVALGIDDAERQRLASTYAVGQTLWRLPLEHFTAWDFNFCGGLSVERPAGGGPPAQGQPQPKDQDNQNPGGTVELPNLTFNEAIPLVGVPFALHYASDRVPGYRAARQLEIPVTSSNVPAGVTRVELQVNVAGQHFETNTLPPAPNQWFTYEWDGKDGYGRSVFGAVPATILLGNVVPRTSYGYADPQSGNAFGFARGADHFFLTGGGGNEVFSGVEFSQWLNNTVDLRSSSLGGWTFSVHHSYDPTLNVVHLGDGRRYTPRTMLNGLHALVGGPNATSTADNIPAGQRSIFRLGAITTASDGTIYYLCNPQVGSVHVRKVTPAGMDVPVTAYETQYQYVFASGMPARQSRVENASGLGVGPDGSLYVAEYGYFGSNAVLRSRIRRITPDGIIRDFAGDTASYFAIGFNGDGRPALETQFGYLQDAGFAVGPDGSVYIADRQNYRVRRIGPEGRVFTVAGTGHPNTTIFQGDFLGASTNGVPATQVNLGITFVGYPLWGNTLALAPDGSLYFDARADICRVTPDGILSFALGGPTRKFILGGPVDSGLATDFYLNYNNSILRALMADQDGSLYFSPSSLSDQVYRIAPGGSLHPFAGRPSVPPFDYAGKGEDGDPLRFVFASITSLAPHPDGGLLIASDNENPPGPRSQVGAIRRAGSSLTRQIGLAPGEYLLPSEESAELYRFDAKYRHVATLDALTLTNLLTFDYDAADRLIAVQDALGKTTTIERDGGGNPTAIVGPFGQRTTLALDGAGYLARVTNPAGESAWLTNSPDGLLQGIIGPRGFRYQFAYDTAGRILHTQDPVGGAWTYTRIRNEQGVTVTSTSADGRTETHLYAVGSDGTTLTTHIAPDGTRTQIARRTDNSVTFTTPDGTVVEEERDTDPRPQLGLDYLSRRSIAVPGLPSYLMTRVRTIGPADATAPAAVTNLTDVVTINGRVYTNTLDVVARTLTTRTPAGRLRVLQGDALGRVVAAQDGGLALRTFSYDARGLVTNYTTSADAESDSLDLRYDALGRLTNVVTSEGLAGAYSYDTADRLTMAVLPGNRPVSFVNDAEGNVTEFTPPGRPSFHFTVDGRNFPITNNPPPLPGGPTPDSLEFNPDRQLTRQNLAGGRFIAYTYNPLGQLTNVTYSGGDHFDVRYDGATGLLTNVTYSAGAGLAFRYAGLLATESRWSGSVTGSVGLSFNADLRTTALRVNNATLATMAYDADGLLTNVGALAITRDPQSGLVTGTRLGGVATVVARNGFGLATNETATFNGAALLSTTYTYDRLGRLTNKVETIQGGTTHWTYHYDGAGRLAEVWSNGLLATSYGYDTNGNRRTRLTASGTVTYDHDDQDRLTAYSGAGVTASLLHTDAGEWSAGTVNGQTTQYHYDEATALRQVTLPGGTTLGYAVDPVGRRVARTVNGAKTAAWLWLGDLTVVAQLSPSNTVDTYFVPGLHPSTPEYLIKGTNVFRILADHLGSPRLAVNVADGTVAQWLDYDEFGRILRDTNPGFQPYAFAGGLYDPVTGLLRFGFRDYDPETGRWTSKDPWGFSAGDTALYNYALNDPLNLIDPTGAGPFGLKPRSQTTGQLIDDLASGQNDATIQADLDADRAATKAALTTGAQLTYEGAKFVVTVPYRANQLAAKGLLNVVKSNVRNMVKNHIKHQIEQGWRNGGGRFNPNAPASPPPPPPAPTINNLTSGAFGIIDPGSGPLGSWLNGVEQIGGY